MVMIKNPTLCTKTKNVNFYIRSENLFHIFAQSTEQDINYQLYEVPRLKEMGFSGGCRNCVMVLKCHHTIFHTLDINS